MMRAAASLCRPRIAVRNRRPVARKPNNGLRAERRATTALRGPVFACASIFLLGYLPGIFLGRNGTTVLGQQLATYYTAPDRLTVWRDLFMSQSAGFFLQLLAVWLCGFTAFGLGLLLLIFAAKGLFLGFCSANILTLGGVNALCLYWLSGCLPQVLLLILLLWLTGHAALLSHGLFQSIFLGGAPRGQLIGNARRLTLRFLLCVPVSWLIGLFCSGLSVLLVQFFF